MRICANKFIFFEHINKDTTVNILLQSNTSCVGLRRGKSSCDSYIFPSKENK